MSRPAPLDSYDAETLRSGLRCCSLPLCDIWIGILNLRRIRRGGWKVETGDGCLLVTSDSGQVYAVTDYSCSCPAGTHSQPCRHRRTVNLAGGYEALRQAILTEKEWTRGDNEMTEQIQTPEPEAAMKRRMPDSLRRYMIKVAGGKYYLPADYRILWFRDTLGDEWGIITELIEGGQEAGFATMRATITRPDGSVAATGHKTESKQDFPAGWVEKAEKGSVARALANLGFGTQFTGELDEMSANRPADTPRNPAGEPQEARGTLPVWQGPGQCPTCHAPEGKRHGKLCQDKIDTLLDVPATPDTVGAIAR